MNERFRKLAEEVFFDKATNGAGQKMYMFGELKMQKFAELIVQECAAICQDLDGESNTDAKSGRQDCAVEIRQHFEVEQ